MNSPNPYAPPKADVRDVSDPGAGPQLAGRGARLGAALLDGVILAAMVYTPIIITAMVAGVSAGLSGAGHGGLGRAAALQFIGVGGLLALIGLIAWIWLTVMFVSRNGQSIAKKLIGIKVVRKDGSKASLGRIFWLRNVVNVLLGIIPFYGLIDVLLIFSETKQCIHDRIADTVVVNA